MYDAVVERVNLNGSERLEIEKFLSNFGLLLDRDVEYTLAARVNGKIIGTCSFSGRVLKCFAVDEKIQGEGLAAKLITGLTDELFNRGIYETFIFTKAKNRGIFTGLNYKEVFSTGEVMLLEGGMANVDRYVRRMFEKSSLKNDKKAAIVMNCNPFTLGHRYLIERAAEENDEVVIFLVEENRSLFPFDVRLELVKRGVKDLNNVHVIPGGMYIISSNTFPSYFLRQEDERLREYTRLDAGIFGKYICPIFNIKRRYVGTEPYCKVTENYNTALMDILPEYGVEVRVVSRSIKRDEAISASSVRRYIKEGEWEKVRELVPQSTMDFLTSPAADIIIQNIKRSDLPH